MGEKEREIERQLQCRSHHRSMELEALSLIKSVTSPQPHTPNHSLTFLFPTKPFPVFLFVTPSHPPFFLFLHVESPIKKLAATAKLGFLRPAYYFICWYFMSWLRCESLAQSLNGNASSCFFTRHLLYSRENISSKIFPQYPARHLILYCNTSQAQRMFSSLGSSRSFLYATMKFKIRHQVKHK